MKLLSCLAANQTITHTGNLFIKGDVGNNATINVTGGSLIILGNVGSYVNIQLQLKRAPYLDSPNVFKNATIQVNNFNYLDYLSKSQFQDFTLTTDTTANEISVEPAVENWISYFSSQKIYESTSQHRLIINGNVENHVKISSDAPIVANHIGDFCNISSAKGLVAKNIGDYSSIRVDDGIAVHNIGIQCNLESRDVGLIAWDVGSYTKLIAKEHIHLKSIADFVEITTHAGKFTRPAKTGIFLDIWRGYTRYIKDEQIYDALEFAANPVLLAQGIVVNPDKKLIELLKATLEANPVLVKKCFTVKTISGKIIEDATLLQLAYGAKDSDLCEIIAPYFTDAFGSAEAGKAAMYEQIKRKKFGTVNEELNRHIKKRLTTIISQLTQAFIQESFELGKDIYGKWILSPATIAAILQFRDDYSELTPNRIKEGFHDSANFLLEVLEIYYQTNVQEKFRGLKSYLLEVSLLSRVLEDVNPKQAMDFSTGLQWLESGAPCERSYKLRDNALYWRALRFNSPNYALPSGLALPFSCVDILYANYLMDLNCGSGHFMLSVTKYVAKYLSETNKAIECFMHRIEPAVTQTDAEVMTPENDDPAYDALTRTSTIYNVQLHASTRARLQSPTRSGASFFEAEKSDDSERGYNEERTPSTQLAREDKF